MLRGPAPDVRPGNQLFAPCGTSPGRRLCRLLGVRRLGCRSLGRGSLGCRGLGPDLRSSTNRRTSCLRDPAPGARSAHLFAEVHIVLVGEAADEGEDDPSSMSLPSCLSLTWPALLRARLGLHPGRFGSG